MDKEKPDRDAVDEAGYRRCSICRGAKVVRIRVNYLYRDRPCEVCNSTGREKVSSD